MVNKEYSDYLISKLPNFFRDYAENMSFIEILFDAYGDIVNYLQTYARAICGNKLVAETELNFCMPLGYINTTTILTSSVDDTIFVDGTTITKTLVQEYIPIPMLSALNVDNNSNTHFKNDALAAGLDNRFKQLTMCTLPKNAGVIDTTNNYEFGSDYYIGKFDEPPVFSSVADIVKGASRSGNKMGVMIRDGIGLSTTLEDKWGRFLPNVMSKPLARNEYRNFLTSVVGYEPTIAQIQEIISILIGVELEGKVIDKFSKKNLTATEFTTSWTASDSDFILKIPTSLGGRITDPSNVGDHNYNVMRLDNIIAFLDVMRPSDTAYTIVLE